MYGVCVYVCFKEINLMNAVEDAYVSLSILYPQRDDYCKFIDVNTLFFKLLLTIFATTTNTYITLKVFKPFEDDFISYTSFCSLLVLST